MVLPPCSRQGRGRLTLGRMRADRCDKSDFRLDSGEEFI